MSHPLINYSSIDIGRIAANACLTEPIDLIGISVWQPAEKMVLEAKSLANELLSFLNISVQTPSFEIIDNFVGQGYGIPTSEGLEVLKECFRTDGVLLDPVYTAKTMGGIRSQAKQGRWKAEQPVVFWHTGGCPAVFAAHYRDAIAKALLIDSCN